MEQAIAGRKLPVTQARRWDWQRLWIAEIRRAILWVPVGLGLGIWLYFSLLDEPDPLWCLAVLPPLVMLLTGWAHRELWRLVVALALLSLTLGFSAALWQAHRVAAPVLPGPIDETVEGRVIAVDRSQSGSPRVLLDQVEIYGLGAARIPDRVRVTLRAEDTAPLPGQMMRVYARLSPLSGPLEPGGFDFRRQAFFKGLGAVGFARGIVVPLGTGPTSGFLDGAQIWLEHQRLALSRGLVERLPGPSGAFAAAIIVGDRSHIDESDAEALRAANLSHLLAISGLHMGILTGLIFVSVRIGLAALPMLSLYMSTKKLAAVAALLAGAAYLAVSGGTVATQRAFIMVAVALAAVQLDRPALTLRALAVAAVLILLIRPISLLEAGFQMSFAATTALVAGFEALRDARRARERDRRPQGLVARIFWALLLYGGGLVMTSLLAGLATAPFAAFHFNRMAPYGLPANLAAVPAMGLWVAPAAVLSGLLAPFGWEGVALRVMGAGIDWILAVAHWTAALPGAVEPVAAAPASVLSAMSIGGLWLALFRGPWRLFGLGPILAALWLWSGPAERPALLVSSDARLVGRLGPEGRALDQPRASGFIAERWMERDGDLAEQAVAATRPGLEGSRKVVYAPFENGWTVVVLRRPDDAVFDQECRPKRLVISDFRLRRDGACKVIDGGDLRRLGALAIDQAGDELRITPSTASRNRLWSPKH